MGDSTAHGLDAAEVYARAGVTGDVDLLMTAYADGAALHSPISGRLTFRGKHDLRLLMAEVYAVMRDAHFTRTAREGSTVLLTATSRVWGVRTEEAFALDLDDRGSIRTTTVHVRPWFGLTTLALALGLRMLRRPGVLWRALRAPAPPA